MSGVRCGMAMIGFLLMLAPLAAADFAEQAAEVRTAMARRDLPGAKMKLAELKEAAKSDAEKATADRLDLMYGYLFDFWKAVHAGGQSLVGAEEIMINNKPVAVVEYDVAAGKLVLRTEGQNKRYTLFEMPPRVALTLAERVLKKGAPENEAYIGTFLAIDARGDRKLAREAFERAKKGGVDVKDLLAELEIDLPAAATIELPKLTPQTAAFLRPQLWQVAAKDAKGWKKTALGKQGVQNANGQLEVAAPESAEAVWVTFAKKAPANFGVRIYFADLPQGQKFGLFNEKAEGAADAYVELPKGIVKVEFARRSGDFHLRINDADQKLTIADADAAKTSGIFGFTLPPGGKCAIAGCEFAP
jgi:hypothetical protein